MKIPPSVKPIVGNIAAIVVVLLIWFHYSKTIPYNLIDDPFSVLSYTITLFLTSEFYNRLGETLFTVFSGFILSFIISLIIAYIYILISAIRGFVDSLLAFILMIPSVIAAYVAIIIIGNSAKAIIWVIFLAVMPHLLTILIAAVTRINLKYLEMAKVYRLNKWIITTKIVVPQIMPILLSLLNNGLAISWKIAVLAEAFVSSNGIGNKISYEFQLFSLRGVLSWLLAFMLVIFFIKLIIRVILGNYGVRKFYISDYA